MKAQCYGGPHDGEFIYANGPLLPTYRFPALPRELAMMPPDPWELKPHGFEKRNTMPAMYDLPHLEYGLHKAIDGRLFYLFKGEPKNPT